MREFFKEIREQSKATYQTDLESKDGSYEIYRSESTMRYKDYQKQKTEKFLKNGEITNWVSRNKM